MAFGRSSAQPTAGRPSAGRGEERCWQFRRSGGIDGNDCQGGRHQPNRMTGRQRAARPNEPTRRKNLASPVQGWATRDRLISRRAPQALCVSGPGPAMYSRFLGRAARAAFAARTRKDSESLDRARKRREREASAAMEERNSTDCTDISACGRRHEAAVGGAGHKRTDRRMSGPEPWVAYGLPRSSEREARPQGRAEDAANPLSEHWQAPAGHVRRRAGAGPGYARVVGQVQLEIKRQRLDGNPNLNLRFYPRGALRLQKKEASHARADKIPLPRKERGRADCRPAIDGWAGPVLLLRKERRSSLHLKNDTLPNPDLYRDIPGQPDL